MFSAFYLLSFQMIGHRPALLFTYLFVIDLGLLTLTLTESRLVTVQAFAGLAAFIFLGAWTGNYLTTGRLYTALGFYFVFALFHSATPIALQRFRKIEIPPWTHVFLALALLVALIPIFEFTEVSQLVWPFVLVVDFVAIVLAIATATLLPVVAVLVLTLVAVGSLFWRIPSELTGLPNALCLLGGFAIFFFVATNWAARRAKPRGNFATQLPTLSATLPFLLLIMVTLRLPLANPSPVFGLALVLAILLLSMTRFFSLDLLPAVALVSVLTLEHAWHFEHFDPAHAALPLVWYLGFYALFTIFPFIFQYKFASKTVPWAAAALAGPLYFYLVYDVIRSAYPSVVPGLVPAAFGLPALLGLSVVLKRTPLTSAARNAQLALFNTLGTVLAFFIVNIEIADYFSPPGAVAVTFQFSGNFARDMIYSLAWALFALLLLIIGMRKRAAPARYAGLGLLGITVVKLFFHDLSQLDQLYRIGAFIVVAVIAIPASFLYQRFLAATEKNNESRSKVSLPPTPV